MNKRKIIIFSIILVLMLSITCSVSASETIVVDSNTMNIVVDGDRVFADNFVYENTTYVPLRRVAEMLGKKVDWDASSNAALITDTDTAEVTTEETKNYLMEKEKNISVDRNTINIFVNAEKVDADNFVYKNTTYVPLRKISEMFKKDVTWEKLSNTATIGTAGIGFFDGKVLGTINGIEYTDYMYEYYSSVYDMEYEYYQMMGEDADEKLKSRDEYVINCLKKDFALIDYSLKNGYSMTPLYNISYYESVKTTLEGVKGDMEKFDSLLRMQGFNSLNAYYYAMLTSDLFVQYASRFESEITAEDIHAFYEENNELNYQYSLEEATPDIIRILSQNLASESIDKMAENAIVKVN